MAFHVRSRRASWGLLPLLMAAACGLASCDREERRFEEIAPFSGHEGRVDRLPPAIGNGRPSNPYEKNAWAISQGRLYYTWFNCVGCHGQGGGGIGPALMDGRWIYGSGPADIYTTIMDGRPNGMPPFRSKLTSAQAWQIVAYVRSMSGLVPMDAAPGRNEGLAAKKPESMQEEQRPYPAGEGQR
jgi:cytochrome c oxidase cbb3-type subunit III